MVNDSKQETIKVTGLAPIVLFVYNRLWHTKETIEALRKNDLADQSELIVYSDAAKDESTFSKVQAVRDYLKTVSGFKSITIIEREFNWGLAKSIITGVTEVINRYGKIIVLEDDIVTSPGFLSFMNYALSFYQNESKVWHISGWNYPIDEEGLGDAFFWRGMNCWGWATWEDRWNHFKKDSSQLINNWSSAEKYHFDLDGSRVFWPQVIANEKGKINTWAIFWYATIYKNIGLCLNPSRSYVDNIGHDGSGTHCGKVKKSDASFYTLCQKRKMNFPEEIFETEIAVERIKIYYRKQKKPFLVRVINKLSRLIIRENIIQ